MFDTEEPQSNSAFLLTGRVHISSRALLALLPGPTRTPGPVQPKTIRPLEKKLGHKPATPQTIEISVVKIYVCKLLGQFLPIIVKIRPQL
jgi:hypothetical protein